MSKSPFQLDYVSSLIGEEVVVLCQDQIKEVVYSHVFAG